ncbi:MAG TPA: TetR family transcriptional regulator C-terminal domain-containing protein, partial [Steroidobacteraceae bacterium]|nr:TetR family transcriptional regulator C-terminal domain-containing protein [Steroidobacteraceae bacterium]
MAPERASRVRQRQRLIDACISALHIHGPSRTTVEKVVALADMSPGIVRFYFDSKDAMLLASLAHLAAEFEERVLVPVAQLRDTPVAALERLVDLYLDPDIASPRKVSVWYSFWGEASSRQEYYDICGRKDEDFAALVRDLVARVVAMTGNAHLDVDGIALGLMGALEVLWQGIAFQSEADIDREAARRQSMGFLRSVFPKEFEVGVGGGGSGVGSGVGGGGGNAIVGGAFGSRAASVSDLPRHLPRWAYSDGVLLTAERERLFRPAWQVIGHEAEVSKAGDFLTGDLAGERALVVRDEKGMLRAFRNACRRRPHALVTARTGRFSGVIPCAPHGLSYGFDGKLLHSGTDGDLTPLEIKQKSGLILVRAAGAQREGGPALTGWDGFAELVPLRAQEVDVAADWKLLVEQWLEGVPTDRGRFLAPNQLVEGWRGGAAVLRVLPTGPGRSRLQRLDYGARRRGSQPRQKLDTWIAQQIELAESTQTGLAAAGDDITENGPVSAAL